MVSIRRVLQLPISVWRRCEAGSFNEVGEAGEATPDYRRPRWCVGSAVEVASEPRDGPDIELEVARHLALPVRRRLVEQVALILRENGGRVRRRRISAEHCQP